MLNYQVLAENLASHGYIVASINPTYSSDFVAFSDGSVVYRTPEGSMPEGNVSDEELNEVGSKLIETWTGDISFVINKLGEMNAEKGSMWTGHIDMKHIGVFGHSFGGASSTEACLVDNRIKAGYLLEIPKAAHFSFSDDTLFFSPILKALGVFGTINAERGLQITNSYITAFLINISKI